MVEGRAVPPDRGHVGRVAREQQQDRRRRRAPSAARWRAPGAIGAAASARGWASAVMPPPGRGRARSSRPAARAGRPSDSASTMPAPRRPAERAGRGPGRRAGQRSPRPAPRRRRRRSGRGPARPRCPRRRRARRPPARRHRHRLEHLVLDAARDPSGATTTSAAASQGRTSATSPVTITPPPGELAHRGGRLAADDGEARVGRHARTAA